MLALAGFGMARPFWLGVTRAAFLAVAVALSYAAPAFGAPLKPAVLPRGDCLDYLNSSNASGMVDWRDSVIVEHCDRMQRLWRISNFAFYGSPPQFFDGLVGAAQLPSNIGVSMPLLRVVFPERVFFDTDRSELRPEAIEVVRIVARNLQMEPPDVVLFVAGHADARGDRDHNQALSVDRANAIAEAIAREGVNVASVWRIGFGEDMPLVPGDTLEAYGQNRRVEFLFAGRIEVVTSWLADAQLDMLCQGRTRSETNRCRANLDLRNDYEGVRVTAVTQNVSPGPGGRRVAPTADRVIINPTSTHRQRINPVNN
jgi:OmpA family